MKECIDALQQWSGFWDELPQEARQVLMDAGKLPTGATPHTALAYFLLLLEIRAANYDSKHKYSILKVSAVGIYGGLEVEVVAIDEDGSLHTKTIEIQASQAW